MKRSLIRAVLILGLTCVSGWLALSLLCYRQLPLVDPLAQPRNWFFALMLFFLLVPALFLRRRRRLKFSLFLAIQVVFLLLLVGASVALSRPGGAHLGAYYLLNFDRSDLARTSNQSRRIWSTAFGLRSWVEGANGASDDRTGDRFVLAFRSAATNLVPADNNHRTDVFAATVRWPLARFEARTGSRCYNAGPPTMSGGAVVFCGLGEGSQYLFIGRMEDGTCDAFQKFEQIANPSFNAGGHLTAWIRGYRGSWGWDCYKCNLPADKFHLVSRGLMEGTDKSEVALWERISGSASEPLHASKPYAAATYFMENTPSDCGQPCYLLELPSQDQPGKLQAFICTVDTHEWRKLTVLHQGDRVGVDARDYTLASPPYVVTFTSEDPRLGAEKGKPQRFVHYSLTGVTRSLEGTPEVDIGLLDPSKRTEAYVFRFGPNIYEERTGKPELRTHSFENPQTAANGPSQLIEVSRYPEYLGFTSDASNLVANDQNGVRDVFRKDGKEPTCLLSAAYGEELEPGVPADAPVAIFLKRVQGARLGTTGLSHPGSQIYIEAPQRFRILDVKSISADEFEITAEQWGPCTGCLRRLYRFRRQHGEWELYSGDWVKQ